MNCEKPRSQRGFSVLDGEKYLINKQIDRRNKIDRQATINLMELTEANVWQALKTVIDPELNIDIVSLGLIYQVQVSEGRVKIVMTLTTPGCPLAGMFDTLVKDALVPFTELDLDRDVALELTFDPPWVPDMISPEARAELGFD